MPSRKGSKNKVKKKYTFLEYIEMLYIEHLIKKKEKSYE